MKKLTASDKLKMEIEFLKAEQADKLQKLKENFNTAYEHLRPVNLVKNTLKEIITSPNLVNNIIGTTLGLTTGFFLKRLVMGASVSKFSKLLGTILQFGITNVVAKNTNAIQAFGSNIFQQIFHKKERIFLN
jgi:hypothetical protein